MNPAHLPSLRRQLCPRRHLSVSFCSHRCRPYQRTNGADIRPRAPIWALNSSVLLPPRAAHAGIGCAVHRSPRYCAVAPVHHEHDFALFTVLARYQSHLPLPRAYRIPRLSRAHFDRARGGRWEETRHEKHLERGMLTPPSWALPRRIRERHEQKSWGFRVLRRTSIASQDEKRPIRNRDIRAARNAPCHR